MEYLGLIMIFFWLIIVFVKDVGYKKKYDFMYIYKWWVVVLKFRYFIYNVKILNVINVLDIICFIFCKKNMKMEIYYVRNDEYKFIMDDIFEMYIVFFDLIEIYLVMVY